MPTTRPKISKPTAPTAHTSHTAHRALDHMMRMRARAGRAVLGATMGRVCRPTRRSPAVSLKSCAWIVEAKMPALQRIDSMQILSSEVLSLPIGGCYNEVSYSEWKRGKGMRMYMYIPATRHAPISKEANPKELTILRVDQCPEAKPSSS